jgi:hypothetical protein
MVIRFLLPLNNSCSDTFILDQRGLFFTQGDMEEILEPIYDGAFGSVRTMGAENFSKITATTECMATFQDGNLTVIHDLPRSLNCLLHSLVLKSLGTLFDYLYRQCRGLLICHFYNLPCIPLCWYFYLNDLH